MNEKHVNYLSLGKNDADIMAAGTLISQASDMIEGVIAVVNSTNTTVVTEQTSGKVRIVQRVGNDLIYSPFIDVTSIRAKRGTAGVAAVQQISYVGYNGSSGAMNAAVSSDYIIRSVFKNSKEIADWAYKSAASTDEYAVAEGLVLNFNLWKTRQADELLSSDVILSCALATDKNIDNTATVVNGVKTFNVATAATHSTGTLIAVGDYIRIEAPGVNVKLISSVYKVTSVDSLAITVDRPITNTSGSYTSGKITVILPANIGNAGIKFTGVALPQDAETRHYHTVKFTLGIDGDFSVATPITYSIDGSEGVGTKAQIAISERQLQMNDGQSWVNAYPSIKYRAVADTMEDTLFPLSIVTIDCIDSNFVPILGDNPKSYYTVTIVTPNATGYGKLKTVFAI